MLVAAALLLGMGGVQDGVPPRLPSSIQTGELEACAPTTVPAAEDCLRHALSADDLAIVSDRISARQFRPHLDLAIIEAWRLRDVSSPMGREMSRLLGFHRADIAAGLILSDLQARAAGGSLDFSEVAAIFRANPPPPERPLIETTPADPHRNPPHGH